MPEVGPGPILVADRVSRSYRVRARGVGGRPRFKRALDRVSVQLWPGEIVGVVGRSGAGKTTLAKVLMGLDSPEEGSVLYDGRPLRQLSTAEIRQMRRSVQAVFQDPHSSLDPRQSVEGTLSEPLAVHRLVSGGRRRARCLELLRAVGLPDEAGFLERLPRELSGGERQRVAIARALACEPILLILDEPVSALDVSVRGQVLNLLLDLQRQRDLAMMVIAHDVRLVSRLCGRVVVVAEGRIVEEGDTRRVLGNAVHPATVELLAAARWLERESPDGAAPRASEPGPRR